MSHWWISNGKTIYLSPNGRGGHGLGCTCFLPDNDRVTRALESPNRKLQVLFHENRDVSYRYFRRGADPDRRHELRIDWPITSTSIKTIQGKVLGIIGDEGAVRVQYSGEILLDYVKKGFLRKIDGKRLWYEEDFHIKGTSDAPHILKLHDAHCRLSTVAANSTTNFSFDGASSFDRPPVMNGGVHGGPHSPSNLSPAAFFAKGELRVRWALEVDEKASREANFDSR